MAEKTKSEHHVGSEIDWQGLITSQNVTAPKHNELLALINESLITSQNVTAPKPVGATLEQAESRIASNNYETGVLVDSNGFVVAAYKGGAHSVNFGNEPASLFQNATLTHNHPSGLPAFSVADIATPGIYALDGGKIRSVRATSVNGTFSLSAVSQNADWGKLATKYSKAEKMIRSKAVDAMTAAISQAKRQGKSNKEVLRAGNRAGAKVYASWFKRAATKKSGFKFEYEE